MVKYSKEKLEFFILKKITFFLYLCFFLSGISGLIYEIVWAKYLTLIFGSTAYAHSLVLATFMGGLALGSYFLGKAADKVKDCIIFYAVIEIIIGIYCLFTPYLFTASKHLYLYPVRNFLPGVLGISVVKFVIGAFIILLPAILMGGTLPILCKVIIRSTAKRGKTIARLYCINSLGAVIGTILAGFYFIYYIGLHGSILIAVVINVLIGVIILIFKPFFKIPASKPTAEYVETIPQTEQSKSPYFSNKIIKIAFVCIFLSGFTAMLYEVVWIRLLTLVLGGSTYSFSLMLAAFISGITIGSYFISKFMPKDKFTFLVFGLCEIFIGFFLIITLPFYEKLPYLFIKFSGYLVRTPETFVLYSTAKFFLSALVMILPTIFLGMTIPLVTKIISFRLQFLGKKVGSVLALNTAGNILGALITGLILIKFLGLRYTLELGILLNLLMGGIILLNDKTFSLKKRMIACIFLLIIFLGYSFFTPAWNVAGFSIQAFRNSEADSENYQQYQKRLNRRRKRVVFHEDGLNATVSVIKWPKQYTLYINGKADASSGYDMNTQILSSQIPLIMLNPDAKNVMIVGLGSGVTCGSALLHPIDSLDLLEISPLVVKANKFFATVNYNALEDKRLHLYAEDVRTFLQRSNKKYDVIISEPSNPWLSGTASLFSIEFFNNCKAHLTNNGLMVQWVQTYSFSKKTFSMILRTFCRVFPKVQIWKCGSNNILLIGSEKNIKFDPQRSAELLNQKLIKEDLARIHVYDLFTLLSMQLAVDVQNSISGKGIINSDYHPLLEYMAPLDLYNQENVNIFSVFTDERRNPTQKNGLFIADYLIKNKITYKNFYYLYRYFLSDKKFNEIMLISLVEGWIKKYPKDKSARSAHNSLNINALNSEIHSMEKTVSKENNEKTLRNYSIGLMKKYEILRSFYYPSIIPETAFKLMNCAKLSKDNKTRYYYLVGSIFMNQKDYKNAVKYFLKSEKTINLQKNIKLRLAYNISLYNKLSYAYFMESQFNKALEYAGKTLSLDENNILAKDRIARIQAKKMITAINNQ